MDFGIPKQPKDFDRFEFAEKDNKVRVLDISSDTLVTHFTANGKIQCTETEDCEECQREKAKGKDGKKPAWKRLAYIWDYKKEKIMLAFIPKSVVMGIEDLSNQEDWVFESLPMPYDINVVHNSKAAPKDMYKVFPTPNTKPLSSEAMEDFAKLTPLDEIVDKIKANQSIVSVEPEKSEDLDENGEPFVF